MIKHPVSYLAIASAVLMAIEATVTARYPDAGWWIRVVNYGLGAGAGAMGVKRISGK